MIVREQENIVEENIDKPLENDPFVNILLFAMSMIGTKHGIDRVRKSAYLGNL